MACSPEITLMDSFAMDKATVSAVLWQEELRNDLVTWALRTAQ
jgi:hypothetical protein